MVCGMRNERSQILSLRYGSSPEGRGEVNVEVESGYPREEELNRRKHKQSNTGAEVQELGRNTDKTGRRG